MAMVQENMTSTEIDRWQTALSKVDDDVREIFDAHLELQLQHHGAGFSVRQRRVMLEMALGAAQKQHRASLANRWKVKKRNGEIIILRDVFEKIVHAIQQFKTIGDAAAQYAPEYAALPWGVLGFLLNISVNDNEMFVTMIDGVERITHLIARYAVFESVYFQQPTSAREHLETSMVNLYASVLTFLAMAYKYFGMNTAKRFFKNALSTSFPDLKNVLEEIERRQVEVDRTASIVGVEIMQRTFAGVGDLRATANRMSSQLEMISIIFLQNSYGTGLVTGQYQQRQQRHHHPHFAQLPRQQRSEPILQAISSIMGPTQRLQKPAARPTDSLSPDSRQAISEWLSPIPYKIHHSTQRTDRLVDSGQWMFNSSEFRDWNNSSVSSTLWLHGMPGSGKTKLASAVIDAELERRTQQNASGVVSVVSVVSEDGEDAPRALAPIAFFYCSQDKAEPERADPAEVLRCIARQLCGDDPNSTLNEALCEMHSSRGRPDASGPRPSLQDTVTLILNVLADNPATIIIDALDECDPVKRFELFEALDRIVKESANVVKVLVTSRNDRDIVCRLRTTPNLYIDATRNKDDIRRFISTEVYKAVSQRRMLGGRVSADLQSDVVAALDEGANGTFRWVSLQIQNLCDPRRMKLEDDVRYELSHLPESLADLYSLAFAQMLQSGHSSSRLALYCLRLLLVAARPIPWEELLHLLSGHEAGLWRQLSKDELLDILSNFLDDDVQQDRPRFVHLSAREYLETRNEFHPMVCNMTASVLCIADLDRTTKFSFLTPSPRALSSALSVSPRTQDEEARNYSMTYSTLYLGYHLSLTTARERKPHLALLKTLFVPIMKNDQRLRLAEVDAGEEEQPAKPSNVVAIAKTRQQYVSKKQPQRFREWRRRVENIHHRGLLGLHMPDHSELCVPTLVCTTPLFAVCAAGLEELLPLMPDLALHHYFQLNFIDPMLSLATERVLFQLLNKTCMEMAVIYNHPLVLRQLHSLGFSLDALNMEQETLLHFAARINRPTIIDELLTRGANPNVLITRSVAKESVSKADSYNRDSLPLTHISRIHARRIAQTIARPAKGLGFHAVKDDGKHGVLSPFQSREAKAPIHLAAEREDGADCLRALLRHSITDVNLRTSAGATALHLSFDVGSSKNEHVRLLIKAGADVEAALPGWPRVLDSAAMQGLASTAMMLVTEGGANADRQDAFGRTARDLAAQYGHQRLADMLRTTMRNPLPSPYSFHSAKDLLPPPIATQQDLGSRVREKHVAISAPDMCTPMSARPVIAARDTLSVSMDAVVQSGSASTGRGGPTSAMSSLFVTATPPAAEPALPIPWSYRSGRAPTPFPQQKLQQQQRPLRRVRRGLGCREKDDTATFSTAVVVSTRLALPM